MPATTAAGEGEQADRGDALGPSGPMPVEGAAGDRVPRLSAQGGQHDVADGPPVRRQWRWLPVARVAFEESLASPSSGTGISRAASLPLSSSAASVEGASLRPSSRLIRSGRRTPPAQRSRRPTHVLLLLAGPDRRNAAGERRVGNGCRSWRGSLYGPRGLNRRIVKCPLLASTFTPPRTACCPETDCHEGTRTKKGRRAETRRPRSAALRRRSDDYCFVAPKAPTIVWVLPKSEWNVPVRVVGTLLPSPDDGGGPGFSSYA